MSARRPSSSRSTASRRSVSNVDNEDFEYQCKAGYLVVFDDVDDYITNQQQLREALQQAGRNPTRKMLEKFWTKNTGKLSFDDFVDICRKIPVTTEDDLMKAFRKIDINGDGYITSEELYKTMTTRGEKMTRKEVKTIIDEVDANGDGKLDYKEFCSMMLSTQQEVLTMAKENLQKKGLRSNRQSSSSNHKPAASPRVKNKFDDDSRGDSFMGSRTSLQSTSKSNKSNGEMGSQISLRSTSDKKENEDMGSQVSVRSASKNKRLERRNSLTSADKSDGDQTPTGSQVSLKAASVELKKPEKDKLGSQISLKSQDKRDEKIKENFGSSTSLKSQTSEKPSDMPKTESDDDEDDDEDIVIGSQVSLNKPSPAPRKASTTSALGSQASIRSARSAGKRRSMGSQLSLQSGDESDGDGTPKPRPRKSIGGDDGVPMSARFKERTKSPVATKSSRLAEPKKLKNWYKAHSKGALFLEDDGSVACHQYSIVLEEDSPVWITIEPNTPRTSGQLSARQSGGSQPIDTMLFILRDRPDDEGNLLAAFTEQRDSKGKYCVQCELEAGKYHLIPFTTKCRLQPRKSEPKAETKLVKKEKDDTYVLTKAFKEALEDIFHICDLDGNGLLSREEFNWFNIRTSGEEVADEEWEVVEENVDLKNHQLTPKGFVELNQMEAEDNQGDTDDLWVTLSCMGYSKDLVMDESCPFLMEVFSEECEVELKVTDISVPGNKLERAICEAAIGKGEASKIKSMKDLSLHTYVGDFSAHMVVENKSKSKVTINLDCSKSKNCTTHRKKLDYTFDVPGRATVIAHHILPENERQEWTLRCVENVK